MSSVFFPERSERASGDRCAGARMASHSPLRIPTDSVDIPNTLQSEGGGTTIDINSSEVVREVLASGDHTYALRRPVVSPAACSMCVFTNNYFVISIALTIFGVPAAMLTWGVGALCFFPVCMRHHSGRSHKFLQIFN